MGFASLYPSYACSSYVSLKKILCVIMQLIKTEENIDIKEFYSIVNTEYNRTFGYEFSVQQSLENYYFTSHYKEIFVIKISQKIIGGFELNVPDEQKTIPCQKYVKELESILPNQLVITKNYVEISRLAVKSEYRNFHTSKHIISKVGDLCFYRKFNALVIFAPKTQTLFYKKVFNTKEYSDKLKLKTYDVVYELPEMKQSIFYLSVICRV
ncbi:hypothetical protein BGP_1665 [Beggiatoa sp. PS]|nr:hypothetical protein BGP_1665 [Beggiatoa sp. PS]